MSKAKQRKQSAYSLGYRDAKTGYGFRWLRHPNLKDYREGYQAYHAKKRGTQSIYPLYMRVMLEFLEKCTRTVTNRRRHRDTSFLKTYYERMVDEGEKGG